MKPIIIIIKDYEWILRKREKGEKWKTIADWVAITLQVLKISNWKIHKMSNEMCMSSTTLPQLYQCRHSELMWIHFNGFFIPAIFFAIYSRCWKWIGMCEYENDVNVKLWELIHSSSIISLYRIVFSFYFIFKWEHYHEHPDLNGLYFLKFISSIFYLNFLVVIINFPLFNPWLYLHNRIVIQHIK